MRLLTPEACAAELAQLRGEWRTEFRVHQVTPAQGGWLTAFLPIRDRHATAVAAFLGDASEGLRSMLKVCEGATLRAREPAYYDALPSGGPLLLVGHHTDFAQVGHGDVVEALRSLARHLADARFFVREGDMGWIDELRIEDGVLRVVRRVLEDNETYDSDADQLLAIAWERPDPQLESLVARLYLDEASEAIERHLHAHQHDERRMAAVQALAHIENAQCLAGGAAAALATRAFLELTLDEIAEADTTARSSLEQTELPLARFVALATALEQGRDADALIHAAALARRAPFISEGLVAGLTLGGIDPYAAMLRARVREMAQPFRDRAWVYLFDTARVRPLSGGARGELLDDALLGLGRQVAPEAARDIAMILFGWGEQLRLVSLQAGTPRKKYHARARRLMDAALALCPLGAEALQRRSFLQT